MNQADLNRNTEQLTIQSVKITSTNQLNLTLTNTGSVSSRLLWLGLFNQSVTPEAQWFVDLTEQVEPAETISIISTFAVAKDQKYVVQIATAAGNIYNTKFYPASEVKCALTLVAGSPTVYLGQNITLFLTVTHNDTNVDVIQNITVSLQTSPLGLVSIIEQPSSLTIESLKSGETAFFRWIYQATSTGTVTFNATYNAAPSGIFAVATVNIATTPSGGAQGQVTITGQNGSSTFYPTQWATLGGTQYVSGTISNLNSSDLNPVVFRSYYTGAAPTNDTYYPSSYNLLGSTQLVSGTLSDLQTNNGAYMTFQSGSTIPQLYAHSESVNIAGSPYYLNKLTSSDGPATNLSASMGTAGRQLLGKFVYPLTGVTSIPASTWTMNYRTWRDAGFSVGFDSGSSTATSNTASLSWSHTTGSGSNRLLVVGVSIRVTTVSVSTITYGAQSLTFIRADTNPSNTIRSELWYLIAPASGTATVTVTLSGTSNVIGGAATYTGVVQTSPLDAHAGGTGSSSTPSQSITVNSASCLLIGNLAIRGSNAGVSSEGAGQTARWDSAISSGAQSARCRGHGSSKGPVGAGSQSMSWVLGGVDDWAVSVAAFKTANPSGSVDVDILIRQSNNAIRSTIATAVASSPVLSTTVATLQGTYSWNSYTVVSQTDYLEIDYYVNVASAVLGANAYLQIDNNAPSIVNQTTRATNVLVPNEYRVEVEFSGTSNTDPWASLVWTIDSSFSTSGVTATFQLYNYTADAYSTSGEGYITDTIGTTDITKTQNITANQNQFKDGSGNWRLKVTGIKITTAPFNWQADFVQYTPFSPTDQHTAEVEFTGSSNAPNWTLFTWTTRTSWNTSQVFVTIQFYNFTLGDYVTSGPGYLMYTSNATPNTYELKTQSVTSGAGGFTDGSGNWRVKITGVKDSAAAFTMNVDLVAANATYLSSGTSILYNALHWYTIKATSAGGAPIPYSYIAIYVNGTSLTLKNALTNAALTVPYPTANPTAWLQLDVKGEYQLYLQSTSSTSEVFVLYASAGTTLGQKTITQEAP